MDVKMVDGFTELFVIRHRYPYVI